VHDLPDFVYFDHSIHVQKGVGCVECHGRVDAMPLMWRTETLHMSWCLDCHRNPEPHIRPRELVFSMEPWPPAPGEAKEANETNKSTENAEQLAKQSRPEITADVLMELHQISNPTNCSVCHR
jgi:hypothetical protein